MQWSFLLSMDATSWSQLQFLEVCHQPGVLQSLQKALAAYNKKYPIKIVSGLFIDATATQIDTCRLAALMIEPQMFSFLANRCHPGQGRAFSDNPHLRAQALLQDCMQQLQRLFNDVDCVPQANASIEHYCPDLFISTACFAEIRDYAWIASTFQSIKTTMGTLMSNFSSSGDLEQDANDAARDVKFWNRFCNHQPMWMYIYLLWDHGRESTLAWNSIALPEGQCFDLGCGDDLPPKSDPPSAAKTSTAPPPAATSASAKKSSKKKRDRGDVDDEDPLLIVSQNILNRLSATGNPSTDASRPTASTGPVSTAEAARALCDHADVLKKQIKEVDEFALPGVKDLLLSSLGTVMKKLCALTD